MYIEGIISEVDGYKAKIKVAEFDDMETEYLSVLQMFTVGNKSGFKPEIGAMVAAVVNDDMSSGAIIGQIYNDIDTPPENSGDAEFIYFADGCGISHIPGTEMFFIKAGSVVIDADIVCNKDIADKNGTMQEMRKIYNSHLHTNGNDGADTGAPKTQMT